MNRNKTLLTIAALTFWGLGWWLQFGVTMFLVIGIILAESGKA